MYTLRKMLNKKLLVPLVTLVSLIVYVVSYNSNDISFQKLKIIFNKTFIKDTLQNVLNLSKGILKNQNTFLNNNHNNGTKKVEIQNLEKCSFDFKERLYDINNIANLETKHYIDNNCNTKKEQCKMEKLLGRSAVNLNNVALEWLYENELQFVREGGWFAPQGCSERQSTAIIIPFRNRERHLSIFLRRLHTLLKRQQLHYRIFVIEQTDNSTFNRGKLMNVGFNISQEFFPYNCFVFHDVDLKPEDDRIDYGCKNSPTHLTVAIDTRGYKLSYSAYFGGGEMFTKSDYEKINGYSNSFWYWGLEDDNLEIRTSQNKMRIHRQSVAIARYTAIKHPHRTENSVEKIPAEEAVALRANLYRYNKKDGLNTLQYKVLDVKEEPLYTHIKVNLRKGRHRLYGVLYKFKD